MKRYESDRQFEEDVRRIADAVFEMQPGECKPQIYSKGKKTTEIDGLAKKRDISHLIMATTSTSLKKVEEDVEKLKFAGDIESINSPVKRWMIVEKNPEAPHVSQAKRNGVELITLQQFRERFFDGRKYLELRDRAPFGSARDPETGSPTISAGEYIEPPIENLSLKKDVSLKELTQDLKSGKSIAVVGPFGSGKSLSLREVWKILKDLYRSKDLDAVPVAINLREHWGAEYADEILRRHARSIGFEREADLIAAWRAGMVILLIDGFDEMASQGVANFEDIQIFKRIRFNALAGVRNLITTSPNNFGILITGRDHYFDNFSELENSLGLLNRNPTIVRVDEFDEVRAREYLTKKGIKTEIPDWLPRKALLLSYLVRQKLLEAVLSIDGTNGQAKAWHSFLELICKREAEHDRAAMDYETLQKVLENLAIQVRATSSGVGPISGSMLAHSYKSVTYQIPSDSVLMQLQRLPGLTERDSEPGSRSFVDQEFLETLQGAAISRQLIEGASKKGDKHGEIVSYFDDKKWYEPLGDLASGVAVTRLQASGWTIAALTDFIRQFSKSQFGADLLKIATTWSMEVGTSLDLHGIEFENVQIEKVDLDEYALRGTRIVNSVINTINIGSYSNDSEIYISNSLISSIAGAGSLEHLPKTLCIENAKIEKFEILQTTDAIIQLDIDDRIKALLSALKKLFRQRGAGRVEGAFRRGLPANVEKHISDVLRMLVTEGFAWKLKDVYHPIRNKSRRAHQILDNPHASKDLLISRLLT